MKSGEFFIVAAEESANQYASRLIDQFQSEEDLKNIKFSGIGFQGLGEKGFDIVYPAEKLAVMGLLEVIKKWRNVKEAFKVSLDYIVQNKPKAVLLIDFGGFNLKLAKEIKLKSPDTKILYFISPKFWVWGEKRALKVKSFVDQMYVIHPFEVDFYKKWGVDAKFVGHPLLEEFRDEYLDPNWIAEQKVREGFSKEQKVLGLLLGSRASEIRRLQGPFLETVRLLKSEHKDLGVAVIIPPSKNKGEYGKIFEGSGLDVTFLQSDDPMEKISLCDLCLVASGTATLQVGLLGIPMAIGYEMSPITMYLAKRFAKGVKYAGLVNILKGEEVSKEFLQQDLKPEEMAKYLNGFLKDSELYQHKKRELLSLKADLGSEHTYERLLDELASCL